MESKETNKYYIAVGCGVSEKISTDLSYFWKSIDSGQEDAVMNRIL